MNSAALQAGIRMEAFIDDLVLKRLRLACFSYLHGWNSTPNGVGWNVFGNHCTGRDHGALSDLYSGKIVTPDPTHAPSSMVISLQINPPFHAAEDAEV